MRRLKITIGNFWEQAGVVSVLTAKQDHDFFAGIFGNLLEGTRNFQVVQVDPVLHGFEKIILWNFLATKEILLQTTCQLPAATTHPPTHPALSVG